MELKQNNSSKKVFHYNDHWNKAKQPGSCGYHAFVLKNYFFIPSLGLSKKREIPNVMGSFAGRSLVAGYNSSKNSSITAIYCLCWRNILYNYVDTHGLRCFQH